MTKNDPDNHPESRRAVANSLSCAADLLNSAAMLIEMEEDQEAERFLASVRTALVNVENVHGWHEFHVLLRAELDKHMKPVLENEEAEAKRVLH